MLTVTCFKCGKENSTIRLSMLPKYEDPSCACTQCNSDLLASRYTPADAYMIAGISTLMINNFGIFDHLDFLSFMLNSFLLMFFIHVFLCICFIRFKKQFEIY